MLKNRLIKRYMLLNTTRIFLFSFIFLKKKKKIQDTPIVSCTKTLYIFYFFLHSMRDVQKKVRNEIYFQKYVPCN